MIAYALLHCKRIPNIATISREAFSELLLDLTPSGDHAFNERNWSQTAGEAIELDPAEARLLILSDMVSRTRMLAAAAADFNIHWVRWLGIAALVASGLATLAVTVQSRLQQNFVIPETASGEGKQRSITPSRSPPTSGAAAPATGIGPEPPGQMGATTQSPPASSGGADNGTAHASGQSPAPTPAATGGGAPPAISPTPLALPAEPQRTITVRNGVYEFWAYSAIFLTVVVTGLTGVAEFFDPNRAYSQNERTLLELRRLHQDIALGIRCQTAETKEAGASPNIKGVLSFDEKSFENWAAQLIALRPQITPHSLLPNMSQGAASR